MKPIRISKPYVNEIPGFETRTYSLKKKRIALDCLAVEISDEDMALLLSAMDYGSPNDIGIPDSSHFNPYGSPRITLCVDYGNNAKLNQIKLRYLNATSIEEIRDSWQELHKEGMKDRVFVFDLLWEKYSCDDDCDSLWKP